MEVNSDLTGIEGLTVYDQDLFEEKVSKNLNHYVEKQQREHDFKRLHSELKDVKENLAKSKENLSKTEKSLNEAVKRGITSDRRLQVFLEQQEKYQKEIEKLTKSKKEIETELENLEKNTEEGEINEEDESNQNGNLTRVCPAVQSNTYIGCPRKIASSLLTFFSIDIQI